MKLDDILITIALVISIALFGGVLYSSYQQEQQTQPNHDNVPPIVKPDHVQGINKYQVRIFATTDKFVLQDCLEKGKRTDGFYIGNIKGTRRIILFCGHRPDLVGKYVTYTTTTGI